MSIHAWKRLSTKFLDMANQNTFSALEGLRDLSIVPGAVYLG